jgi:hypothetical protein
VFSREVFREEKYRYPMDDPKARVTARQKDKRKMGSRFASEEAPDGEHEETAAPAGFSLRIASYISHTFS